MGKEAPGKVSELATLFLALPSENPNREFAQLTLPGGQSAVVFRSGELDDGLDIGIRGLPWGCLPRRMLAYCFAYRVRHFSSEIAFGENNKQFMEMLCYQARGNHAEHLEEQLERLAGCSYTVQRYQLSSFQTFLEDTVERFGANHSLLRFRKQGRKRMVTLSEHVDGLLQSRPIPINFEAFCLIDGRSIVRQNLYVYLADSLYRIDQYKPQFVSWDVLYDILASTMWDFRKRCYCRSMKSFKSDFKLCFLPDILKLYPEAKVKHDRFWVWLYRSKPPVEFESHLFW